MSFGKRLQDARLKSGLTLDDVAQRIGKSKSTVQRYESGEVSRLDNELILSLADVVNVSPVHLMGWQPLNTSETTHIPLLGNIVSTESITAEENVEEYRDSLIEGLPSGDLFYLKAQGNSMAPRIPDGSYVLVRVQSDVENGEIAAVLVNGDEEATLKRVRKLDESILLEAINEEYEPFIISGHNPARIVGKAVKVEFEL